jgi:hypothetical protein
VRKRSLQTASGPQISLFHHEGAEDAEKKTSIKRISELCELRTTTAENFRRLRKLLSRKTRIPLLSIRATNLSAVILRSVATKNLLFLIEELEKRKADASLCSA